MCIYHREPNIDVEEQPFVDHVPRKNHRMSTSMFILCMFTVYPRLATLLNFIKSWVSGCFWGWWGAKELSLVRRLGRVALPHIPAADGVHQGAGGNGCGAHHACDVKG